MSGPKKRQPNRSFSIRQSLPLICADRKKDMGCPTPAKRRPASNTKTHSIGPSAIAVRRKNHRRERDIDGVGAFTDGAGGDVRLERDGFMADAASLTDGHSMTEKGATANKNMRAGVRDVPDFWMPPAKA